MDYAKFLKGIPRVDLARLALWVALLFVVLVVGMAVFNSGLS